MVTLLEEDERTSTIYDPDICTIPVVAEQHLHPPMATTRIMRFDIQ